jgi:tRNA A-37 threonylcarbamoyl transferase component Bud32
MKLSQNDPQQLEIIIDRVRNNCSSYFPKEFLPNDRIHINILDRINKRNANYSFFYKLELVNTKSKKNIWVSLIIHPEELQSKLCETRKQDYVNIGMCWNLFKDNSSFSLSRALDVIPEMGVLITEHCPGVCLTKYLKKKNVNINNIYYRVGKWLSILHNPVDKVETNFLDCFLQILRKSTLSNIHKERLRLIAKDLFIQLQKERMVLTHNDFASRNIIVSDEKIYGIDFLDVGSGFIYNDLGFLLCEIMLMRTCYSQRKISDIKDSFLLGYAKPINHKLLNLFTVFYMIKTLNKKKDITNTIFFQNLKIRNRIVRAIKEFDDKYL